MHQVIKNVCRLFKTILLRFFFFFAVFVRLQLAVTDDRKATLSWKAAERLASSDCGRFVLEENVVCGGEGIDLETRLFSDSCPSAWFGCRLGCFRGDVVTSRGDY